MFSHGHVDGMNTMFSLPTWVVTRCALFVIKWFDLNHPWKSWRPNLADWQKHQTELCRQFDLAFWMVSANCICWFFIWLTS